MVYYYRALTALQRGEERAALSDFEQFLKHPGRRRPFLDDRAKQFIKALKKRV